MFQKLWADQAGAVISSELVLVMTVTVIGAIAGLVGVRDTLISELGDVSSAVRSLNQSFGFSGVDTPNGFSVGSTFTQPDRNPSAPAPSPTSQLGGAPVGIRTVRS